MQTLKGMQDDAVGSAAATLLHQLLLHLKEDLVKATGQAVQRPHQHNVPQTCYAVPHICYPRTLTLNPETKMKSHRRVA